MWFFYAIIVSAALTFAARKWGWQLYHRFGRPIFLRRLMGKPRASTPPLDDRRSNDYSVFQVYDDGSIISSRIEKPQPVNFAFISTNWNPIVLQSSMCVHKMKVNWQTVKCCKAISRIAFIYVPCTQYCAFWRWWIACIEQAGTAEREKRIKIILIKSLKLFP